MATVVEPSAERMVQGHLSPVNVACRGPPTRRREEDQLTFCSQSKLYEKIWQKTAAFILSRGLQQPISTMNQSESRHVIVKARRGRGVVDRKVAISPDLLS